MSIVQEFKDFAVKGNAVDLAVGVVVGAAFGAITNSLVDDIINPPLGFILGGIDFDNMGVTLREATETTEAVVINYGAFISSLINFLVIAFVLFLVVKTMNHLRRQMEQDKEDEDKTKPAPPTDIKLLTEIRDLLKMNS
jgi:large conductance mechanosensitive channel